MEEMELDETKKLSNIMDKKVLEKRKRDDEKEGDFLKSLNLKNDNDKAK